MPTIPVWTPIYAQVNDQENGGDAEPIIKRIPTTYAVVAYRNPFNPSTTIANQLVDDSRVTLRIYDLMGRDISDLVEGDVSAGYYSARWNGKNQSGNTAASGMYFYRFVANPLNGSRRFVATGKLLLIK